MAGYSNAMGYSGQQVDSILEDYYTKFRPTPKSVIGANWNSYTGVGEYSFTYTGNDSFTIQKINTYSFIGNVIQFYDWGASDDKRTINMQITGESEKTSDNTEAQLIGTFNNRNSVYIFLLTGSISNNTFTATGGKIKDLYTWNSSSNQNNS